MAIADSVGGAVDFSVTPDAEWLSGVARGFPNTFTRFNNRVVLSGVGPEANLIRPGPDSFSHLVILADVRLHNRLDLLRHLDLPSADEDTPRDDEILLAAYEKWGVDCVAHLLGEFAFAIFDSRRRRLFCARDHIGFRPFFYWSSGTHFLFASSRAAILSCPGVSRRLNRHKFAGTVIHAGHTGEPGETFHEGILCLPAACSLIVEDGKVRQYTYWQPEVRPGLVPRRPEEVFEALRELLFESVNCRVAGHSPIATELSGGLDSSAVTSIAAKCLAARGEGLLALACVLDKNSKSGLADEREYIEEFRTWPNVRIGYATALNRGPFDGIEDVGGFVETPLRTSRHYLYDEMERAAVDAGARLLLPGAMGEMGATQFGNRFLIELAAKGRWLELADTARQMGRIEKRNPVRLVLGQVRQYLTGLLTRSREPFVLLTEEFRGFGTPVAPFRCASPIQRVHQTAVIRRFLTNRGDATGQTVGGKIRETNPLLDKRVLEFCLAAPPDTKVRNGYMRYLIRGAMEGVMPEKIRLRTSKLPFSPDYFVRYNAQLDKAREFVDAIGPSDPIRAVIDVPRLRDCLRRVPPGVRSRTARDTVPQTIYAISFLRQFSDFRP